MATPDSIFGARVRGRFGTEQIAITRCHTRVSVGLNRPNRSKSLPRYKRLPTRKKSAKKFRSYVEAGRFTPKRTLCDRILMGKKVAHT